MATEQQPTSRAAARAEMMRRIVELGNAQLAEQGVASLSVREIARGLGVVSSAIYRYVRSRDDLLTLLIVDAYTDLGDAVEARIRGVDDPRAAFVALGEAMTDWAIANPERWTLLYGTPVRDYDAPAATTNEQGTRVTRHVLELAARAAAGQDEPATPATTPGMRALLDDVFAEFELESGYATATRAMTAWSGLVGVISAHVFGQLGADARAVGREIIAVQLELLADLVAPTWRNNDR
ncbi:TetR/AcrR family transcriptional regulator [Gulosibacter faecalis]|uniref:TetR/AcrR family transcriptional regulator n=1 Tax=Gulosibacter faecalis TaxID=272240 RepID=A0ABW5UV49_9MICO|nr:TetR/AcrR family transcriptional regulator [Gulosibacter faecalis]